MIDVTNVLNVPSLVSHWLDATDNGVNFPVSFKDAWVLAGYKGEQKALSKLKSNFKKGEDYLFATGRFTLFDEFVIDASVCLLTTDCFKRFCLSSKTKQGKEMQQYFIKTEKEYFRQPVVNVLEGLTVGRISRKTWKEFV